MNYTLSLFYYDSQQNYNLKALDDRTWVPHAKCLLRNKPNHP